jgi:ClpP class serine protease
MALWLIEQDAALELQRIMRSPLPVTTEMVEAYRRSIAESGDGPRCLTISGPEAAISIVGVLTKTRDAYYYYYDVASTTYQDICAALAIADKNPDVKRITLNIDSPGGRVDGLFETLEALRAMTKPVTARCTLAASGAYGIASQCKRIEAVGVASMFGSIGVATSYAFWNSETLIELTNTDSPDKRPDVRTEAGKAVVVRELDAIAALFIDAIAIGRSVNADDVRTKYGRGAMFVAADAKRAGMIDAMPKVVKPTGVRASTEDDPQPSADGEQPAAQRGEETQTMDLKAFKAQHPDLFTTIQDEAHAAGVSAERKRVNAHLKLGTSSGAMDVALKAIATGTSSSDEEVQADYLSARMNRGDQQARQTESKKVEDVVAGGTVDPGNGGGNGPDLGDQVVAIFGGAKKS